ncbi:MAG: glycosyltransferase family 39 protein [Rivularia sp. ALOHA_DT_140]|nr:glycosyltransferase family 39 protein [Rivularia sp. ALOHA_DT_140]
MTQMLFKLNLYLVKRNFRTWTGFPYFTLLVWMLPLLLLGIDNNSLMAHDEGLYAWRSRLMYDSGDWINPWKIPHHKTPGFYWLLAIFYSLFGINENIVRLPNMILGILSVLLIYEISKIILNKRVGWLAGAILSVEFLWLQYSRLGTPDVPMVFLVLLGILSLLKAELNPQHRYIWGLIAGLSFSLGFLFRSFMIFLPIIALSPYLILQHRGHNHLKNPMLYVGILLGLVPTMIWLRLSYLRFGDNSFAELINLVKKHGSNERRNNNWTYYFWNISILAFPWSLFGCLGTGLLINKFLSPYKLEKSNFKISNLKNIFTTQKNLNNSEQDVYSISYGNTASRDNQNKINIEKDELINCQYISILIGFPLILFIELSIFSTRLSHYSLCLYPCIAILAAVALNWLGKNWGKQTKEFKKQNIPLYSKYLSSNTILRNLNYIFATLGILLSLTGIVVFFISDYDGEIRNYAILGLVLGLSWLNLPLIWIARHRFGAKLITARYWIGACLISSWLTIAVTGSLGFLSNYNPDFQSFLRQPEIAQVLQNHPINFVDVGGKTGVLINFYTPKHGKRININEISQLTSSNYAWIPKKEASKIPQPHQVIGEVQKYLLIYLK